MHSLAITPILIGAMLTATNSNYKLMIFCFGCSAAISACLSFVLLVVDHQNGTILNLPRSKLKLFLAAKEAAEDAKGTPATDVLARTNDEHSSPPGSL